MPDLSTVLASLQAILARPTTMLLMVLLAIAAVSDARSYRIPNALTVAGMMLGLAVNTFDGQAGVAGFLGGLGGLFAGLVALLPMYVFGISGAGDVKLMAMVGAFLGVPDVLVALLFVFLTGGVLALLTVIVRRVTRQFITNLAFVLRAATVTALTGVRAEETRMVSVARLPYAVCIALGTLAFLIVQQLALG